MAYERLDLGPSPHIVVSCRGSLDVRGVPGEETRLDGGSLSVERTETGAIISSPGDCTLRLPPAATVELREVLGDLRAKELGGGVTGHTVNGTCYVRRVGSLALDEVLGDARIREVAGQVRVGTVHGSLTVRDVQGVVSVESVLGDFLGRDLANSLEIGEVHGAFALYCSPAPGVTSRVGSVSGDAVLRVLPATNMRIILPGDAELEMNQGLEALREGDRRVVTIGSGEATVMLEDVDSVLIKRSGGFDEEASFAYAFTLGSEVSEHLANISAELEAQFATLEADLASTISERVRRQVERRLHNARRQVDAAQRHVEREVERAQRRSSGFRASVETGGQPGASPQAVTEEERLMILRMLEEGKISVEEAEDLLSALEGRG